MNIFNDNPAMLELCQAQDLASMNRVPLLMGVLSGHWLTSIKPKKGDPRARWFENKEFLKLLVCVQLIGPCLTIDGRSCVQGALGWIWARSRLAIPLPGFRNMQQMKGLTQAQQFGPLSKDAMRAILDQLICSGIARKDNCSSYNASQENQSYFRHLSHVFSHEKGAT